MNPNEENLIATATKSFVQRNWHLPINVFEMTQNRAWVLLAGRLFADSGKLLPVKTTQQIGEWSPRSLQK
jgi:hypothetical protein